MKQRIVTLAAPQAEPTASTSSTYASVAASGRDASRDEARLDKLEFFASEQERLKYSLDMRITHPSIDTECADLKSNTHEFFTNKLQMGSREVDANFTVRKLPRPGSILVTFSDKRFRKFAFLAKKRLRENNPSACEGLFLNDNLTHYNLTLLHALKKFRKARLEKNESSFASVYTFEGKVFVREQAGGNARPTHISNNAVMRRLIASVGSIVSTDQINMISVDEA